MIDVMELADNIIACQVDGKVGREDLQRLSEEVDRKAASGGRLRVYVEVGDISLFNLMGLSQDLKSFTDRKHLVDRIDRAAIVTDSSLVKQGMQYSNRAPASVEIKMFSSAERDEARRWISAPAA